MGTPNTRTQLEGWRNAVRVFAGPTFKDADERDRAMRIKALASIIIPTLEAQLEEEEAEAQQPTPWW